METHGHMQNINFEKGPRALEQCDVWPKHRAHLLEDGHDYEFVTVMFKNNFVMSEALLRFHYPTLYENEYVLFCDTGDHIVVYIATQVDASKERA